MMDCVWYCEWVDVKPHIETLYNKCPDRPSYKEAMKDIDEYHLKGMYVRLVYKVKNMGYSSFRYPYGRD